MLVDAVHNLLVRSCDILVKTDFILIFFGGGELRYFKWPIIRNLPYSSVQDIGTHWRPFSWGSHKFYFFICGGHILYLQFARNLTRAERLFANSACHANQQCLLLHIDNVMKLIICGYLIMNINTSAALLAIWFYR